jgi:DNA/RNA endonuclease YhcR with UshA esterase domain
MLVLISLVALATGATTYGHHSYGATYDVNREITLEGKLVQFSYRNPHSYVTIQAPDDKGVQQRWSVEWSGTTQLTNQGITQQTLKVGDQVRVVGRPSRVRNEYRALMVSLLRPADGFTWGTRAGEKVD